MKKVITLSDATVTIETVDTRLAKRLAAYIREFELAEGAVLGLRSRTTQLVEVYQPNPEPGHTLHRVWLGENFVGTCLAVDEEGAIKLMADALAAQGYARNVRYRMRAASAVALRPPKDLIQRAMQD